MSSLLHRIAVFSARRRMLVIGVWLALLVGLVFASSSVGTKYSSSMTVSGSDSAAATDVMARSYSSELTDASPIVYHTDDGKLTDDEHRAEVEASMKALSSSPDVASATDPQESISEDGKTAYSTAVTASPLGDLSVPEAEAILETAAEPAESLQVEAGGQLGGKITETEAKMSELIGIAMAMLILLLVFGTVTAMVLPIAVAIFGLICGLSIISLLSQ